MPPGERHVAEVNVGEGFTTLKIIVVNQGHLNETMTQKSNATVEKRQ